MEMKEGGMTCQDIIWIFSTFERWRLREWDQPNIWARWQGGNLFCSIVMGAMRCMGSCSRESKERKVVGKSYLHLSWVERVGISMCSL